MFDTAPAFDVEPLRNRLQVWTIKRSRTFRPGVLSFTLEQL
jgi:hypothetical protein